ncbi:hypothetical protein V8E54_006605 [Elaphomyces granulatus]
MASHSALELPQCPQPIALLNPFKNVGILLKIDMAPMNIRLSRPVFSADRDNADRFSPTISARRASLESKHPCARKATALSSLPPLMIPLPPALPTTSRLGSAKAQALLRKFCSKRQLDNRVPVSEEKLVLWLQDIVQLHMPTKSTRKRRDVAPVRPRKRNGLRTD